LDWSLGGFAADPPTGSPGSAGSTGLQLDSTYQLVQAMAGFTGVGAADGASAMPLGADASQHPLLATPQHA